MFKKKAVVVNVVNASDLPDHDEDKHADDVATFGAHAYILANNIMYGTALLMGAYFLGDTLRACIVHTVAVRVTPQVIVEAAKNTK